MQWWVAVESVHVGGFDSVLLVPCSERVWCWDAPGSTDVPRPAGSGRARGQGGAVTHYRTLPPVLPLSTARPSPPRPSGLPGVLPRQGLGAEAQASDKLILDLSRCMGRAEPGFAILPEAV